MDDELDERKILILNAIIQTYFETGEPVGSRTISKFPGVSLSSATIRNEMSDLEELGYIVQPHTSAGRIPSDKGYRFYVDHLLDVEEDEADDAKDLLLKKTEKLEELLKQVVQLLAKTTQYPSVVSAPALSTNRVKFVQLSNVADDQLLCVVVMGGNLVKNRIIEVDEPLDNENLLKMNMLLNTNLNGLTVSEINLELIQKMKLQAGDKEDIVEAVMKTVAETINDSEGLEVYTSGATNIFKYPELSDNKQQASEILSKLENKEELQEFIRETEDDEELKKNGIRVMIGSENEMSNMEDCSVVTATYELADGVKGTIGIIGPKRMDYRKVVETMSRIKSGLDKALRRTDD